MASLAKRVFWESYYDTFENNEWYFSVKDGKRYIVDIVRAHCKYPIVLHCGCGSSDSINSLTSYLGTVGYCLHTDFVLKAMKSAANETSMRAELAVFDARNLPFHPETFDIIYEKGLFDCISAESDMQIKNAYMLLSEYFRVLRPGGVAIIISMFGPNGEQKDMLGLLSHPNFSVACHDIPISPAEKPSEQFCYLYVLTRV